MSIERNSQQAFEYFSNDVPTHLGELVLGVLNPDDVSSAMLQAYGTLAAEPFDSYEDLIAEEGRLSAYDKVKRSIEIPVDDFERKVMLMTLRHIFTGRRFERFNVLRNWPLYEHLYNTHVEPSERAEVSRGDALLIGSMTAVSSRAFEQLAKVVYGAQTTHVIDIRGGPDKRQHGTFVIGDGRHMQYDDNSMRIVQTNFLFDQLGKDGWYSTDSSKEADSRAVLRDAYRVLEPGGHLLLCESPIGFDFSDREGKTIANQARFEAHKRRLLKELPEIGFTNIWLEPAFTLKGVDWLFDPQRDFHMHELEQSVTVIAVYARKPDR
jgi:SAM-dependent methyltransferase